MAKKLSSHKAEMSHDQNKVLFVLNLGNYACIEVIAKNRFHCGIVNLPSA